MMDIPTVEALARANGVSYGIYVSIYNPIANGKICPICGGAVRKKNAKYCGYLCYLEGIKRRSRERYQKEKLTRTAIQSEQKEK